MPIGRRYRGSGMAQTRKTVYYSGHVQGVGFRATASGVARDFAVTGYARNLPDGRVELVAEGDPAEVDRFLDAVQSAMAGFIRRTQVDEAEPTGRETGFHIRH